MPGLKARYYAITTKYVEDDQWTPVCDDLMVYGKGQQEVGHGETGYRHYQVYLVFSKQVSPSRAKTYCKSYSHVEPTKSEAYEGYVWKEDTRIAGTQFEVGKKPMKRSDPDDWELVYKNAKKGKLEDIPADIRIRCYNQLKRIEKDFMIVKPRPGVEVRVYWGVPASGKSHAAIEWLGQGYYDKPSMNKWWDGYQGEESVLIDDFDSQIGYTHLKRWFDKYKCAVETKGGAIPLCATRFAVTSNVDPRLWYSDADQIHRDAVYRRLNNVLRFTLPWQPSPVHVDYEDPMFAFLNQ